MYVISRGCLSCSNLLQRLAYRSPLHTKAFIHIYNNISLNAVQLLVTEASIL